MQGLYKSTGYWNTVEARRDWAKLAAEIKRAGYSDIVERHTPTPSMGWKKIDRCIDRMRNEYMDRIEKELP